MTLLLYFDFLSTSAMFISVGWSGDFFPIPSNVSISLLFISKLITYKTGEDEHITWASISFFSLLTSPLVKMGLGSRLPPVVALFLQY